jgi:hypothetical protein
MSVGFRLADNTLAAPAQREVASAPLKPAAAFRKLRRVGRCVFAIIPGIYASAAAVGDNFPREIQPPMPLTEPLKKSAVPHLGSDNTRRQMKKDFPLKVPGKADPRVVEGVKNEVRKYVKRERRKTLPEGFDLWNFRCKVGPDRDHAADCELGNLSPAIDTIANAGSPQIYIEILAEPGKRTILDESA